LLQLRSRTQPEYFSPDSELRWSNLCGKSAPERSFSGVLDERWSKFLSGKSCSWRKSCTGTGTKEQTARRHFQKVQCENDILKNKHNPESFELKIYPMRPSTGLPNLVRLSL
jgi:hypothetical protein